MAELRFGRVSSINYETGEYQLPTAIQNRLAQTGETPESFISRAVDTLVRKEMSQCFNDLPRRAVLDVESLGLGLLLLTFADGDRRLFSAEALKGYPLYKEISTDYGLTCARVEGYSVVFEDKYGIFDELPPEFLYENSVSLFDLSHTVSVKLGMRKTGRAAAKPLTDEALRQHVSLPEDFVKSCQAPQEKPAHAKHKHRKKRNNRAPIVTEEFVKID